MTREEYDAYRSDYVKFMTNPGNVGRCENCPKNRHFDDWQDRKPCGQYNCWVSVHIKCPT